MPTILSGQAATVSTSLGVLSNRRVIDMRDDIFSYDASATPLTLLLNKASREPCFSPKFEWLEDEPIPTEDRINNAGGYTASETSLVVDNGAYFPVNSLVAVQRTGEILHITAVSTNTLTAVRSYGGTAAAALLDNDQLTILGGAAAEGATSESAKMTKAAAAHNFTQIWRTPYDATRTLQQSRLYGGDYLDYQSRKRGVEHAKYIEKALFFGERNEDTTNKRRSTGGIDEWATTNVKDFGGVLTLDEMFQAAEDHFRYNSDASGTKMLFAARPVVSNISLVAKGAIRVAPTTETFGIHVSEILTPHGRWLVVSHPLLEGDTYKTRAYSLDLNHLSYRFLQDTVLIPNIQANDADGRKDEYLTEAGLERHLEKSHAVWQNAA